MSKVDWITWKTDSKELINTEKLNSDLNEKISELNSILDNISNNLKVEAEKGGLSKEALTISSESPSNEVANKIIDKIESIKGITNQLKGKVINQANEQKEIEKKQLIEVIEEKIVEQEKILENTKGLKERLTTGNSLVSNSDVNNIIMATEEKITMLKERLEKAKAV